MTHQISAQRTHALLARLRVARVYSTYLVALLFTPGSALWVALTLSLLARLFFELPLPPVLRLRLVAYNNASR